VWLCVSVPFSSLIALLSAPQSVDSARLVSEFLEVAIHLILYVQNNAARADANAIISAEAVFVVSVCSQIHKGGLPSRY